MPFQDEEARREKWRSVIRANLHHTLRILRYCAAYHVEVYHFTSKLIPLAGHPLIDGWNYCEEFSDELRQLGDTIREYGIHVTFHPDHYTLINSPSLPWWRRPVARIGGYNRRLRSQTVLEWST